MAKFTNDDIRSALGTEDVKNYKILIRQMLAEFLGTFLYLSIVLYARILENNTVAIALANGLLVASIIQMIGHVSGGHINPAITVGALICGRVKILKAIFYIIVQILGSIAGSLVAYAISVDMTQGKLGATVPSRYLREGQVFGLEFLMTFVLVAVFLSVIDSNRDGRGLGSSALAIGLSVTACQCSALNYTGSLNPVRSLGPAVVMDIWDYHWVYWVGPLLGGLVAGLVYKFVFTLDANESE